MKKATKFIKKYYAPIILLLLAISFARPIYENTKSEHLMPWDNWAFVVMAKAIKDNGGMIPDWDNLQEHPHGAPFLYPPLVPLVIAWTSIITRADIHTVVKFMGFLFYPSIAILFFLLTKDFRSRIASVISLAAMIAVSQLFIMSCSSPSQALEIILLLAVAILILRRQYYLAIIPFSLTFFTHFATPFFAGLGIFIYSMTQKNDRKKLWLLLIFSGLIGMIWLHRYLIYPQYITANTQMMQRTEFVSWFGEFTFRQFGFFFQFIMAAALIAARKINVFREKALSFPAALFVGFIPAFYYPERAVAYAAIPISLIFGKLIADSKPEEIKKALIAIIPVFALFMLFLLKKPLYFLRISFIPVSAIIIAFTTLIIYAKFSRINWLPHALVLLLLFTHFYSSGIILPFYSLGKPMEYSANPLIEIEESYDACKWLAETHPDAIVSARHPFFVSPCVYFGLRTTEHAVMEFSAAGKWGILRGSTHKISYIRERQYFEETIWTGKVLKIETGKRVL